MAKGTGAIVILSILAVAGLGLSGYMFVNDQFLGGDENTQGFLLVGLWDDLTQNITNNPSHNTQHDFLLAYDNQMVLNPDYMNVINNTRFTLPTPGLYKINLIMLWNNIDISSTYWIILLQNNSYLAYFDRFQTGSTVPSQFHQTSASIYINSTGGDNYYEINPYSSSDDFLSTPTDQMFNQLSIEYMFV